VSAGSGLVLLFVLPAGRCSIVDYAGRVLCDIYAQPDEPVTDFRTRWSGLRRQDMVRAVPVENARNVIRNIIQVQPVIVVQVDW